MSTESMTPEEQEEIVRYGLERMKDRSIAIGATFLLGGMCGMFAESKIWKESKNCNAVCFPYKCVFMENRCDLPGKGSWYGGDCGWGMCDSRSLKK